MHDDDSDGSSSSMMEMEVTNDVFSNCCALALDDRIYNLISITVEIERLLGLCSDNQFRQERVQFFRQQAKEKCIKPSLTEELSKKLDDYYHLLQEKKEILQDIFRCCEDFCESLKNEISNMNTYFTMNDDARMTFLQSFDDSQTKYDTEPKDTNFKKSQIRSRLPSKAINILWNFMKTHKDNPYPTAKEKEDLALQTNLTVTQIRNWFTNTRKRKLVSSPKSDEDYVVESDTSSSKMPYMNLRRKNRKGKRNVFYEQLVARQQQKAKNLSKTKEKDPNALPQIFDTSPMPDKRILNNTLSDTIISPCLHTDILVPKSTKGTVVVNESDLSYPLENQQCTEKSCSNEIGLFPSLNIGLPVHNYDNVLLHSLSNRTPDYEFIHNNPDNSSLDSCFSFNNNDILNEYNKILATEVGLLCTTTNTNANTNTENITFPILSSELNPTSSSIHNSEKGE